MEWPWWHLRMQHAFSLGGDGLVVTSAEPAIRVVEREDLS